MGSPLASGSGASPPSGVQPDRDAASLRPHRPRPVADAGGGPRDAFVLEASETAKSYAAKLAASETVSFGGGGYCNYKMTLKDIAIEVVILETGDVSSAAVRDLAFEEAVSCPYPPMDPSIQDFEIRSSTTTTSGVRVEFAGAKSNRPDTSLVVDLAAQGAGYEATMTWTRVDQGPPLSWTVTAKVPLARQ